MPVREEYHYVLNGVVYNTIPEAVEAVTQTWRFWSGAKEWAVMKQSDVNGRRSIPTKEVEEKKVRPIRD